jgi:hypothetical protein
MRCFTRFESGDTGSLYKHRTHPSLNPEGAHTTFNLGCRADRVEVYVKLYKEYSEFWVTMSYILPEKP